MKSGLKLSHRWEAMNPLRSSDKRSVNKPPAAKKPKKKSSVEIKESIEDLERQVGWKFGASKADFEDADDEVVSIKPAPKTRGPNAPKFTGFEPKPKSEESIDTAAPELRSQPTPRLRTATIVSAPTEGPPSSERRSVLLGKLLSARKRPEKIQEDEDKEDITTEEIRPRAPAASVDEDSLESLLGDGKLDMMKQSTERPSFRLRKPIPPSPEQIALEKRKADELVSKDEAIKAKKQERRAVERTQYIPFDFGSDEFVNKDAEETLFSEKTFQSLGVQNLAVLKNLETMGIFNPTKIQEIAVPLLNEGRDVLMQAQTGSGKTLAFLLPLTNIIDPKMRKVHL